MLDFTISGAQFHKDNFEELPRFPDFFVTFRILSSHSRSQPKASTKGLRLRSAWFRHLHQSFNSQTEGAEACLTHFRPLRQGKDIPSLLCLGQDSRAVRCRGEQLTASQRLMLLAEASPSVELLSGPQLMMSAVCCWWTVLASMLQLLTLQPPYLLISVEWRLRLFDARHTSPLRFLACGFAVSWIQHKTSRRGQFPAFRNISLEAAGRTCD